MPYLAECREWRLLKALGFALEGRKARYIAPSAHVHFNQQLFECELRRVFTPKDSNLELSDSVFDDFSHIFQKICELLNRLVKPKSTSRPPPSHSAYSNLHTLVHYLEDLLPLPTPLGPSDNMFDLSSGSHQTLFRLPQDTSELKNDLDRLTKYNNVVDQLFSTNCDSPRWESNNADGPILLDTGLRGRATSVLESLFERFKCGGRHEVMLRLSEGLNQATPRQRLHLLLSSCLSPNLWQETLCDLCEDEDSITTISDICDDLQLHSGKGRKLRLLIEQCKIFGAWTGAGSDKPLAERFHKQSLHQLILDHAFKPQDIEYLFGSTRFNRYNIKEKRTLAVQLGYCLMEFFDSELDSENLHIFASPSGPNQTKLLYLSFFSALSSSTQPRLFQVGDPVLVSFAKLLLEIDLGQKIPIEISPHDKEKNQLNWAKLHDCIEKISEERDDSYLEAVKGCLVVHSTISRSLRLGDACGRDAELTIRREIYKEIVSKLEIELQKYFSIPPDKRRRSESPPPPPSSPPGTMAMAVRSNLKPTGTPLLKRQRQAQPHPTIQPLLPSNTHSIDNELLGDKNHCAESSINDYVSHSARAMSHPSSSRVQLKHPSGIPPRETYKTAIICPMAVELAAVLAMLDERHLQLQSTRNLYILGQMGHHNVIVTVMPETGNNTAAMVANQLRNDFPSLQFGLLVGIGGGVPNMYKHDIRLGDVVVSKPTQNFGGVVQFDRGKSNTNNEFERTGSLNKPPPIIMSSLELLIAEQMRNESRLTDHLTKMLRSCPKMEEKQYIYQGEENDVLFKSSYPHCSGSDCRNCLLEEIVKREPRSSTAPKIHYGTIGSSNIVIKDAVLRDSLRDTFGIICVEMEAAGLVDAFPCLVIRGICDYADSHKLKRWQPYAAATAAAFAKEFLSCYQGNIEI